MFENGNGSWNFADKNGHWYDLHPWSVTKQDIEET